MKGHAHLIRASPLKEVNMSNSEWLETAGKHLGITMLFISATTGLIAFIKKIWKRHKEKQQLFSNLIQCSTDLTKAIKTIDEKIDAIDKARIKARKDDHNVRYNMYLGTVAIISAIKELAEHQGLKINGPVQYYYDHNIEALKKGLGMTDIELEEPKHDGH